MKPFSFEDWFEKELGEQINNRKEAVASGNSVQDYAEYRHIVGVISGLTLALNTFKSLAKKHMEQEDD
jgi:hypothetical protein